MIRVIWTHYFETWDGRNRVVHGATPVESTAKAKKRLLRELIMIHADRLKYVPADRAFLIAEEPKDDHKLEEFVHTHTTNTVTNWIDWHAPFFKQSIKEAKARAIALVRPLTEFFLYWTELKDPERPAQRGARRGQRERVPIRATRNRAITEFFPMKNTDTNRTVTQQTAQSSD